MNFDKSDKPVEDEKDKTGQSKPKIKIKRKRTVYPKGQIPDDDDE